MKKAAGYILRFAVSGGIIYYILKSQDISPGEIGRQIQSVDPVFLVIAFASFKACIILGTIRWKLLMRSHGMEVCFSHALGLNYLGMFFNNFMLSITGGDVVKAYYASRLEYSKRAESATIVFFDRLLGLAGLVITAAAAVLSGAGRRDVSASLIIVLLAFAAFLVIGLLAFNEKAARIAGKMVFLPKLKPPLKKIHEAVYFYRRDKKVIIKSLALSVVLWNFMVFMNAALARGLGAEIPAACFFIYIPIINLISSIPVTIAGWGLREQLYVQFFGNAGMDSAAAVSLSVSFALILMLWSLIGGGLYAFHWPMKKWKKEN